MAYVTFRRYEGITDIEAILKRAEEFVSIVSSTPGFISYHFVDGGGGVVVTASVFESKEGAEESNRRAADWVKANLAPLVPNPPQITAGEERVTYPKPSA